MNKIEIHPIVAVLKSFDDTEDLLNDKIDQGHNSTKDITLADYLEMSSEEYKLFVEKGIIPEKYQQRQLSFEIKLNLLIAACDAQEVKAVKKTVELIKKTVEHKLSLLGSITPSSYELINWLPKVIDEAIPKCIECGGYMDSESWEHTEFCSYECSMREDRPGVK